MTGSAGSTGAACVILAFLPAAAIGALLIGVAQCVAMIPGPSRSGATIIGAMLSGMSRQAATEFSFLLAMPTMPGVATYDLYRHHHLLSQNDAGAIPAWLGIAVG